MKIHEEVYPSRVGEIDPTVDLRDIIFINRDLRKYRFSHQFDHINRFYT